MGKPSAPVVMHSFASRCPSCFFFVHPRVFPNGGEAAGGTGGTCRLLARPLSFSMAVSSPGQMPVWGKFCGVCVCAHAVLVMFKCHLQLAELPTCRCKPPNEH